MSMPSSSRLRPLWQRVVRAGVAAGLCSGCGVAALAADAPASAGAPGMTRPAASATRPAADTQAWLRRIQEATQRRSFVGTFVVSAGGSLSTSKITHYCDGRQQVERIEALDGPARRVYRHNETVATLWPANRQAVVEQRDGVPTFPAPLSPDVAGASLAYDAHLDGVDRIAGLEAQVITLKPRDGLRFAQRLWAERQSGLLLRADMLNERGEVIESSAFSEIQIGAKLSPEPILQEMRRLDGWQVQRPQVERTELEREGWTVRQGVHGFRPVQCVRRPQEGAGGRTGMLQAVFSDGLTHVSVFIEPYDASVHRADPPMAVGATHTLARRQGDWWITAVGDVPVTTLRQFIASLERRR
jgi:sigma-E factor negative regulatory protein RseB